MIQRDDERYESTSYLHVLEVEGVAEIWIVLWNERVARHPVDDGSDKHEEETEAKRQV